MTASAPIFRAAAFNLSFRPSTLAVERTELALTAIIASSSYGSSSSPVVTLTGASGASGGNVVEDSIVMFEEVPQLNSTSAKQINMPVLILSCIAREKARTGYWFERDNGRLSTHELWSSYMCCWGPEGQRFRPAAFPGLSRVSADMFRFMP